MKVDSIMTPDGATVYYDPLFRVMLESHLTYLRGLPTTKLLTLDPNSVYTYEGDLFGLLDSLKINKIYHWIIMLINGIDSPNDIDGTLISLVIPDFGVIETLKGIYLTRKQKL